MWDELWIEVNLATLAADQPGYGEIPDGAIAIRDGVIVWVGPRGDLPGDPRGLARRVRRGGGRWVTPGLIDCHTHLVFGGHRAAEFALRLEGASYEAIARAGGGINSTVAATRAAPEEALLRSAAARAQGLAAEGVTTIEVKSGYGLTLEDELKMLRAARGIETLVPLTVRTSFLGAHAIPPEFAGRREAYLTLVIDQMLPAVAAAGLADAVDGFCEGIAFSPAETERLFAAAAALSLPVRLHADQLSDLGGAALAARWRALSADHLECMDPAAAPLLAAAGTVAVLLPGANYALRETRLPPVAALRAAGVPIAIATNCNPGSSPTRSLLLMLNMAATLFRLTPAEALAGVTRAAAQALGLSDRGRLAPGLRADLALWAISEPAELAYWLGGNPCVGVVRGGIGLWGEAVSA